MNNELGSLIKSVKVTRGLLQLIGKKPKAFEVYENGIILKFKNESKEYLFEQISRIKQFNYFTPNPVAYDFEIFSADGEKIVAFSIPYSQRDDATVLLVAHMRVQLKSNFPQQLKSSDFILDNHLSWQKGKLVHKGKKGIEEYFPEQIDEFIVKKGCYIFTLKSGNETLAVFLDDAPNCLTTLEVCRAIASIN